MHALYSFVTGPLAWLAFIVFIGGSGFRFYSLYTLARKKDGVIFEYMNLKFALRSIGHWLTPFGSRNMILNPAMTVVTFAFHICLFLVPIFVFAHVIMWKESFNISWITLPGVVADVMTLIVIFSCGFFLFRRLMLPEVKSGWLSFPLQKFCIVFCFPLPGDIWGRNLAGSAWQRIGRNFLNSTCRIKNENLRLMS